MWYNIFHKFSTLFQCISCRIDTNPSINMICIKKHEPFYPYQVRCYVCCIHVDPSKCCHVDLCYLLIKLWVINYFGSWLWVIITLLGIYSTNIVNMWKVLRIKPFKYGLCINYPKTNGSSFVGKEYFANFG